MAFLFIAIGAGELSAQIVWTNAVRTWNQLTTDTDNDNYGRNSNWNGGNEPNNSTTQALFNQANLEDPLMNQNRTAGQFRFTAAATRAMTFREHANNSLLTLNASNGEGLVHEGGVTHVFDARFAIANSQTWMFTAANGGLTVNDSFNLNAHTLTIDTQNVSNTVEFTGSKDPVTGSGGFTKIGDGTLIFSGAHTFTGAVTVTTGVVSVRHATGLGTTAGGVTVASGAALELQGGISIGAEALTLNGTGISNNGALRNFSGTNSYAGAITLGSDTEIQSDADTLTLSGTISGATQNLTIDGSGNTTISGVIGTTTGSLTKNGGGTLTLSATNTYTGGTTVNAGSLDLTVGGSTGAIRGDLTINSGATLNSTAANTTGYGANRSENIIVDGGTINHTGIGDFGWSLDWTLSDGAVINSNAGVASTTATSKFALNQESTISATSGTSTVTGRLDLRSDSGGTGADITVSTGADLNITAGITDSINAAGFEKLGTGNLT
ncbi:MAG: hypothetical protein HOH58_15895, partial [Opitutaceae bacterium]|nr:hypothetical protein [Opitutaceae bacterium]